ncbi:MAG: hypothetical protein C0519_09745 [Hyphomicrobium sp.]|nr:hypothetical protein [Hyphomicrobium sp.]
MTLPSAIQPAAHVATESTAACLFAIHTHTEPHRLSITVDDLFLVAVSREPDGVSLSVYSAKTGDDLAETYAFDGEALPADET